MFVSNNKKFWKSVSPLFSNKVKSKEEITLVENNETISEDAKIVKNFKKHFDKIVQNQGLNRNLESHSTKTPFWHQLKNMHSHPSTNVET